MEIVDKTKVIEHPMETELDIEPGTTMVEYKEAKTDLVPAPTYDNKDGELDGQLETIYTAAFGSYETAKETAEIVDPRFAARNAEVAAEFLNTALAAVREKAALKQHKDKLEVTKAAASTPGTVNNNVLVADRNDILRMFADAAAKKKPIDQPKE